MRWAWVALMTVLGSTASAASLQVSPTSVTLTPAQNADALWLSNTGTAPVNVQLRVFRWTQSGGTESLDVTQDVIASPPMQTIAPGARQLVRVIRPDRSPIAGEMTYRIIVDELPSSDPQQGLQFVLRYSVPVFVLPSTQAPDAQLQATVVAAADGAAAIEVHNTGAGHAQLADLSYAAPSGEVPVIPGLVGYVLPGQTMRWTLPGAAARYSEVRFSARINGEADKRSLSPDLANR
ncbi:molecular chaperone [Pseudoxanthomonas sp. GM95]|uniref:fimbrial biogenesis chaperone n=1 Tax=Pseudoxanthomonas sp. GM95 TaxID=1881043 RepID=UPI000B84C98A|nr:molecular chaperone [Pseudoxanthomonas sp. GM95]